MPVNSTSVLKQGTWFKPRGPHAVVKGRKEPELIPIQEAGREYWNGLNSVISDLDITNDEVAYLAQKRKDLYLSPEDVRAIHARFFAVVISDFVDNHALSGSECRKLRKLHNCLSELGWAPGE
jgi:hypothetical protein